MAEKKKTLTEQLNDPLFEAIGGLNIFDVPNVGAARERLLEAQKEEKETEKNEELLKQLLNKLKLTTK